ncbi:MAG: hypothetical protein EOP54_11435 [Sphingobacteriales bacterium]|nr:MAG: hypothetical protein EOP54_11435 [Sphingobacteriales bacterium]
MMERICVNAKDVARITGNSIRYGQDLLKYLKLLHNKKKHQFITKKELSEHIGVAENLIVLK